MVDAFIQAGGRSTRLGRTKALLRVGGKPCLDWVIAAAREVTSEITVITSDPQLADFCRKRGIAVASDLHPGLGPLAGLQTALARCSEDAALVLACDMPFLTGDLLRMLVAEARAAHAVVPLDAHGRPQPLCAVYSIACRPVVSEAIERGELRLLSVLERLSVRFLAFSEIAHLPGAEDFFWDLDTPDHYAHARRRFRERARTSAPLTE